jgi:hypothetical protein
MTLVLAELAPVKPSFDPQNFVDPFEDIGTLVDGADYRIYGVGDNMAIATTPLSSENLRDRATRYPRRAAVGAEEAWERFPEYRGEFLGTIERKTLQGIAHGELRLADTIIGDKLIGLRLRLYGRRTYSEIPMTPDNNFDEVVIDPQKLQPYEYLACEDPCEPTSVEGKFLFFCDFFSVRGDMGKDIIPGVKFFSPHALHAHTDFYELWRAQNSRDIPGNFSLHLVELLPDPSYSTRD